MPEQSPKEKIIAFVTKCGFTEQKMKAGLFIKGEAPHMRIVDFNKNPIEVCVSDGVSRAKETYEIPELDDIRRYIETVQEGNKGAGNGSKKDKKETKAEPAPKADNPLDNAVHLSDDMGTLCGYKHSTGAGCILTILRADVTCPKCLEEIKKNDAQPKPKLHVPEKALAEEVKPDNQVWSCSDCKRPVDKKQADGSASRWLTVLCKECEQKRTQVQESLKQPVPKPEPKEAEIVGPDPKKFGGVHAKAHNNLPARYEKKELVIGTCEAVAVQYGIPTELANLFFMKMNEGLYIKNPGLLYLAGKKGYSRIEITDKYDEKSGEWSAECKIYPKLDSTTINAISHLEKENQKTMLEFMTQPTNGTGRASKNNVKMSTMQVFLREMAQTRAQNRALRAFTGYGGTSAEELPEGQVEVS